MMRGQKRSKDGVAVATMYKSEGDDAHAAADKEEEGALASLPFEAINLLNNDVLGGVSSFLECKDMFHLSLTCKQMTAAIEAVALEMIGAAKVRYGGDDTLSALEKVKLLLESPIEFTDLLGNNIGYLRGDKACAYSYNPNSLHTPHYIMFKTMADGDWDGWEGQNCTALCTDYVMTSGRHYAKFTVSSLDDWCEEYWRYFYCRLGIMRPIGVDLRRVPWNSWDPMNDQLLFGLSRDESFADYLKRTGACAWGEGDIHCCFYYDFDGSCEWSNWNSKVDGITTDLSWDGRLGCTSLHGGTREYGLLLDLDAGTLSMYEGNRYGEDKFLGVMMSGLTGEYCWVASILAQAHGTPHQQNVRIERAPVP